jgi:hypothetical protein
MSFSMPVRSKANHGSVRRHRINWVSSERRAADPGAATPVQDTPADRGRRHGGSSQDSALYSCSCGYAFDALVSTSVDCPHCGDRQAW